MTSTEFRAALAAMNLTQHAFAQRLQALGDERPLPTILRTVSELASVSRTTPLPWSVAVLMGALRDVPQREFAERETYRAIRQLVLAAPAPGP